MSVTLSHRRTLARWTVVIVAVVVAIALVACGDDSDDEATATSTPAPSEPTATATAAATATTPAAEAPTTNITEGCVESYDPEIDYFPDKITVEEATDFEIRYENNYKVLTVRTDIKHEGASAQVVVMVQCGTPAPELTGDLADARLLEVPATTFGLNRNDDLASAVALGLDDNLVTHAFGKVFPEDISARIESGDIAAQNGAAFGAQNMDFEMVAAADPDVMLLYLHGTESATAIDRLAELGIPTVPTLTSGSTSVLGRAEWAKVIALPFNQEVRANEVLGDVLDAYRDLAEQARAQEDKPTVIFAQCGTNGECSVARNGWQAEILEDAGLVNVIGDPSAPLRLDRWSIEQVFESGADADWLVSFSWPGEKYAGPLMPSFRSWQENQIISNDAEGVSVRDGVYEYFYSAGLNPHLLLQDIVAQVYPDLVPNHTVRYMGISPFPGQPGQ